MLLWAMWSSVAAVSSAALLLPSRPISGPARLRPIRVAEARSRGYLVNNETRKGRRARIALGDPMPAEIEILPHPDRLEDCCTIAALQKEIEAPSPPCHHDAELAEIEI